MQLWLKMSYSSASLDLQKWDDQVDASEIGQTIWDVFLSMDDETTSLNWSSPSPDFRIQKLF